MDKIEKAKGISLIVIGGISFTASFVDDFCGVVDFTLGLTLVLFGIITLLKNK